MLLFWRPTDHGFLRILAHYKFIVNCIWQLAGSMVKVVITDADAPLGGGGYDSLMWSENHASQHPRHLEVEPSLSNVVALVSTCILALFHDNRPKSMAMNDSSLHGWHKRTVDILIPGQIRFITVDQPLHTLAEQIHRRWSETTDLNKWTGSDATGSHLGFIMRIVITLWRHTSLTITRQQVEYEHHLISNGMLARLIYA